jgi:hypothetical protein
LGDGPRKLALGGPPGGPPGPPPGDPPSPKKTRFWLES